ncbi:deoxyribonuclease-1-like [Tubulanus polymorphus]|uniref:deoxyribonuclease-1-like n=1 Tax=Tubulanus polymorphus TaxID=672921 RepID=UPI003DA3D999
MQIATACSLLFLLSLCRGISGTTRSRRQELPQFAAPPLKIAAFNVQVFGTRKMQDPAVVTTLVKIISRYDIIAIQEIRDSSETAFPFLVRLVQQANQNTGKTFDSVISSRLGRTFSKEQYGFIYRSDVVSVEDTYQYVDPKDVFQREPYAVKFKAPGKAVETFGFIVIHTEPDQAVKEIDALVDVYDVLAARWGTQEILIGGDFNGDCDYASGNDWLSVRLFTDKRFAWLINDCVDTTTKQTDCTYDRFVTAGPKLKSAIVHNSATVFRFDQEYHLTERQTIKVSDHYPIQLGLEGLPNRALQRKIQPSVSYRVSEEGFATATDIRQIESTSFTVEKLYTKTGGLNHVVATKALVRNLQTNIDRFRQENEGVLSDNLVSGLMAYEDTLVHPVYVYGIETYYSTGNIDIVCEVAERKCTVTVYRRARVK